EGREQMISLSKIKNGCTENLWDDVVAGPQPEARGRGHLRRISTGLTSLNNTKEATMWADQRLYQRVRLPGHTRIWPESGCVENNVTTREIGANVFDKPSHPNLPRFMTGCTAAKPGASTVKACCHRRIVKLK
ncbi:hypothetical protein HID58_096072, partial [Brassica napus]